jgi:hypothetical protein
LRARLTAFAAALVALALTGGAFALAAGLVLDLDHERGDQFPALGNKRVVGVQFVLDLFLAATLDIEHFMNLGPHGVVILEIERTERAASHPTVALDLHHFRTMRLAHPAVFFHGQDIVPGNLGLVAHCCLRALHDRP